MKCVMSGDSARVLAKAVQSLAKIGSELYMEGESDGLSIRTVNSTRSAFALIRFYPLFFSEYDLDESNNDEFHNKCKISMKAFLRIFKNMKQVELCHVQIDSRNSRLIIQLKCRLETIKKHSVSIIDVESLQAVYMRENSPNSLSGPNKIFVEISNNFQISEEEITFEATSSNLVVKNYVEGSHVDRRFMRSQLALKPNEFDKYLISEETSITFCLREFRALLNLAEAINLDMHLNFESAGKPAIFVIKNLQTFEANLVMSTLSPDDVSVCDRSLQNKTIEEDVTQNRSKKRLNESECNVTKNSKKTRPAIKNVSNCLDNDDELFNFENANNSETVNNALRDRQNCQSEENIHYSSKVCEKSPTHSDINLDKPGNSEGIFVTFRDTEELQKECVPQSPEADIQKRKARLLFRRCFERTYNPEQALGNSRILAKNSDTED